jgi:flagellar P-ring protein precursor FlgI
VVSQPDQFGGRGATTKIVPRTKITVTEQDNTIKSIKKAATVGDVAAALSALGAKPRDLVSILRALKAAGALRADLETL